MNKRSLAYRLVRNFLIVAASCLLLFFLIYVIAIQVLKSNGVTFQNKDFNFPSELQVNGLHIKQPGLSVQAGIVALDWNWRALLKGNFSGNKISVSGLQVKQESTAAESDDSTSFTLPLIDYKTIEITDASIQILSPDDSLFLQIPGLKVGGLKTGDVIHIDSIINKNSSLEMKYHSVTDKPETESSGFSMDDIPGFEIKELVFSDCDFLVQSDSDRQSVTGFGIELSGVKSKNLLGADLKKLAFVYQDSLNVQANLDSVTINNKNTARLTNLSFNFPGLQLQVPELVVNGFSSPEFEVSFANSTIQNRFMKMFFPSYALKAAGDETLIFEGKLKYANSAIYIRDFDGKLGPKTKLKGNADFDYSGEYNFFDFDVKDIHTSLFELTRYFGYKLPKEQKEIVLAGNFELTGTSQKFTTKGLILANGMPLNVNVLADYTSQVSNSFDIGLKAGRFELAKLYVVDSIDFEASGLALKTTLKTDTLWNLKSLQLALTGDSMRVYDYPVEKPDIQLSYKPKNSWLKVSTASDSISLYAETNDNVLNYKQLSFAGNLAADLPLPDSITGGFKKVFSNFSGKYNFSETAFAGSFKLDTIGFQPDSGAAFISAADIELEYDTLSGYKLDAKFGKSSTFYAKVPADIYTWIKNQNRFSEPLPEIQVACKTEIDSALVYRFTGEKGFFDLSKFEIKTDDDKLVANIEMPYFRFGDYSAQNLDVEIDLNENLNNADIRLESFLNPYAEISNVSVKSQQKPDGATAFNIAMHLPEVNEDVSLTCLFYETETGYRINFGEINNLLLGKRKWIATQNKGLDFNKEFELTDSKIELTSGVQKIGFEYDGTKMHFVTDSVDLSSLFALFMPGYPMQGTLSVDYNYNTSLDEMNWTGGIAGLTFDTLIAGNLISKGTYQHEILESYAELKHDNGLIHLDVSGQKEVYKFDLSLSDYDLSYLNSFPGIAGNFVFEGRLNAFLHGIYDEKLLSSGFVAFENNRMTASKIGLNFGIPQDTLWFKNYQLSLHSFEINDLQNHKLTLDGNINFESVPVFNLRLRSTDFGIFNQPDKKQVFHGNISLASDLTISGTMQKPAVRGSLKTLPGGYLHYAYHSSVSLDDREKVLTFTDFSNPEKTAEIIRNRQKEVKTDWNVDVELGTTDVYILIDETMQDHAKLTAVGNLQLRSGAGQTPLVFGSVKSTEGSVFYDAPMVSDVNLKIEKAAVDWKGDFAKPVLTFRGSEGFRISASEVPGSGGSKNDKIGVTVLALVDECTIDDFILRFDLKSNNAVLANYINAETPETRQSMAINLLLFGTLQSMGSISGKSGMMGSVVAKLNEISRKNIKKADLSFYADTRSEEEKLTQETIDKFGYTFSEGFFDKKVKLTVGGNIDMSDEKEHAKKFNPFGTIQIEYLLKENPEINLFAARKDIYKGAIDGQVQESGGGISFKRKFRNLFSFLKKREKP